MSAVFVLDHYNIMDAERARMFSNVDSALDFLQTLLQNDPYIQNYDISKYVLDTEGKQYVLEKVYDVKELVSDSDVSVIDSETEDSVS